MTSLDFSLRHSDPIQSKLTILAGESIVQSLKKTLSFFGRFHFHLKLFKNEKELILKVFFLDHLF